jgi:hypothetical protein
LVVRWDVKNEGKAIRQVPLYNWFQRYEAEKLTLWQLYKNRDKVYKKCNEGHGFALEVEEPIGESHVQEADYLVDPNLNDGMR